MRWHEPVSGPLGPYQGSAHRGRHRAGRTARLRERALADRLTRLARSGGAGYVWSACWEERLHSWWPPPLPRALLNRQGANHAGWLMPRHVAVILVGASGGVDDRL